MGGDGPEISDTETLKYFRDKLRQSSKIPNTRFEKEQGEGVFSLSAEGINREEIRFAKFVKRLRAIFSEILLKPLYIQMCLKHQEIQTDINFRVNMGLDWYSDSLFEKNKEMEYLQKQSDFIGSIMSTLVETDSEGNQIPYFDFEWAVRKWFGLTDEELKENKRYKLEKELRAEGYKEEDITKIIGGEPKEKFKPKKKKNKEEDEEEDSGGGFSGL